MKKLLFVIILGIAVSHATYSQEIGVRIGDNVGGNAAIDGVFAFKKSRIHADVSFGKDNGLGVVAIYDFIFLPLGTEAFYWYLGVGGSALLGDPFELGVPGELGLEYRFDIPLAIGADWRPTLIIIENTDFKLDRFGLNIRWVIGN